jgi:glycolate oxidase FAD binding subunit
MGLDLPAPYLLLMEAGGNRATADRYQSGYEQMAQETSKAKLMTLTGDEAESLWRSIRNFTPTALAADPETCVIRVSATASLVRKILQTAEAEDGGRPAIVRGGVGYVYCNGVDAAARCVQRIRQAGLRALVEYAPVGKKKSLEQWANPGRDLEVMRRIKQTFDPSHLLNPGRLFQHI